MKIVVAMNRENMYNAGLHGVFLDKMQDVLEVDVTYIGFKTAGIARSRKVVSDNRALISEARTADMLILYRGGFRDLNVFDDRVLDLDIPKILIDVDCFCFRKKGGDEWSGSRIDLHLARSNNPEDLKTGCKHQDFLKFAVDPEVYKPVYNERRDGICFSGNRVESFYKQRVAAIKSLGGEITVANPNELIGLSQAEFYSKHLVALTGSSKWLLTNAKHYEIPATGALLFTDLGSYMDNVLPKGSYVRYDPSTAIDTWNAVKKEKDKWIEIAYEASEYVHRYHTIEARWIEFTDMVNNYLDISMPIKQGV